MTPPIILGILLLASIMTISLSKDLSRALRWFLRTLGRVVIGLAIVGLCYAALFRAP